MDIISRFENKNFIFFKTDAYFVYFCTRKDGRVVDCIGLENRRV